MIQVYFAPLFAQDPPPTPPTVDISIVPLVIPIVDLEGDGVVPVLVAGAGVVDEFVEVVEIEEDKEEDGLELHDLARFEVFPTTLSVMPSETVIKIADLEDSPPPVSNDDGGYDTESRHICRFRLWPPRV